MIQEGKCARGRGAVLVDVGAFAAVPPWCRVAGNPLWCLFLKRDHFYSNKKRGYRMGKQEKSLPDREEEGKLEMKPDKEGQVWPQEDGSRG